MKQCPTCHRTYADETLTYCLADGSLLSAPYDPEATQRIPIPRATNPPPTEVLHSAAPPSPAPARRAGNPVLPYLIVGLLALIVGGGTVALLKSRDSEAAPSQSNSSQPTTPATVSTQTPAQKPSSVKEKPEANSNQTVVPITSDAVNNLIARWKNAQNTQNFTAYEACYGYTFKGVLRTNSGRVKVYDFNSWMVDRRRMINQTGGLDVDARNIRVRIDGDTATVEFDQYYRSNSYSDWGPKLMKIKATTDGEKIVYEELKASYSL